MIGLVVAGIAVVLLIFFLCFKITFTEEEMEEINAMKEKAKEKAKEKPKKKVAIKKERNRHSGEKNESRPCWTQGRHDPYG